jgi:hypothetical protein
MSRQNFRGLLRVARGDRQMMAHRISHPPSVDDMANPDEKALKSKSPFG